LKNKFWREPIAAFALRFAFIFGLLIFPWPGWDETYGHYFQALGSAAFREDHGPRAVVFSSYPPPIGEPGVNTRIELANRDLLDENGRGLMKRTELNTRSIGWVPTALTLSLIAATPIPWYRRVKALVGGVILVHAFILFSLQAWIWNNSPDVSLLTLSDFWKKVADGLDYTLINQLGASFSVPVLIWILVTFQSRDARRLLHERN
jgi:hypothetical protein